MAASAAVPGGGRSVVGVIVWVPPAVLTATPYAICVQTRLTAGAATVNSLCTIAAVDLRESGLRFPQALREAREAAGLSYRALAARCGLSHSFLSQVEKGQRRAPPMDRVVRIAQALGAVAPGFLVAALADRAGEDVALLSRALLQARAGRQRQGPPHGALAVEFDPSGQADELRALAETDAGVGRLRARLYFVDLQFDAEIVRVAFRRPADGQPTIFNVVGGPSGASNDDGA